MLFTFVKSIWFLYKITILNEYKLPRVQKQIKTISNLEGRSRILNQKNAWRFGPRESYDLVELSEITKKEYRKIPKRKTGTLGVK